VPYFAADPAGLAAAARAHAAAADPASCPYARDGLHILHRGAHYALGASPLALAWKDGGCSRYAVDTDAAGVVPPRQPLVLRLLPAPAPVAAAAGAGAGAMTAVTGDEPPVALAVLPRDALAAAAAAVAGAAGGAQQQQLLRRGALMRFELGDAGLRLDAASGRLVGAELRLVGAAGRRGDADTCSKARAPPAWLLPRVSAGADACACMHACLHAPPRAWMRCPKSRSCSSTTRATRRSRWKSCSRRLPRRSRRARRPRRALLLLLLLTWTRDVMRRRCVVWDHTHARAWCAAGIVLLRQ
jgi:hypothetical protein